MNGITHKQAQRFMRAELDGLLADTQRRELDVHLRECEACRAESESLSTLPARLRSNFQGRWNTHDGPSQNVIANIHSQTRRIIMSNRIRFGLQTLAGIGALIVLGFVINFVFSQLRNTSITVSGTETTRGEIPAKQLPLIAFTSDQNGNLDIYTMRMDGSDLANLTNNPANDYNPEWSPDGMRIAFGSDRRGSDDIFIMNADGSHLTQLTDNLGYDGIYSWSHDGQKIIYSSSLGNAPNADRQLIIMNPDGSNKIALTKETGSNWFLSWSLDGQEVVYQKDSTDPNGSSAETSINSVHIDSTDQRELFKGGGIQSMRWDDARNFSGIVYTQLDNANWYLYRFNIDGTPPVKLGGSNTPIDGWLIEGSRTIYITKNNTTWFWHDDQKKFSEWTKWDFASNCKSFAPIDIYLHDADHVASPDGKHLFVIVNCNEGLAWFYLVNADGSQIRPLANISTPTSWQVADLSWSLNGKYVTVAIASREGDGADLYLFDIEKMLIDPSTKPIQLTTDGTMKYGTVWQPQP
jgi:Tol biopolymer transport system component